MSGNTTVVTVGNTTVSTSGALTGALLEQFASALSVSAVVSPSGNGQLPQGNGQYNQTLIIPSSVTGNITVPSGYEFVIYMGNGTLNSTDPKEVIIGDLNYTGNAGTVMATGGTGGTTNDSQAGAVLSFASGANTVSATGAGQTVNLDSGTNDVLALATGQMFNQSGGASTINAGAGSGVETAMASGGNMVFFGFGAGGGVVSVSGSTTSLLYEGIETTADTIYGGAGSDTVIAGSAVYHGGSGSNLFVGGSGTSTIYGATNETVYGGTGGDVVSLAGGSNDFVVAHGGANSSSMAADSVMLGAKSANSFAQIWGNNNENLTIGSAPSAGGAIAVAYGNNDSIDMTNSNGGNTVVVWNAVFGPSQFTGNTTLTGSNAGSDIFVMFGNMTQLGSTASSPHTIMINNWQASDILDLSSGYSAADVAKANAALAAGSSFTLSDGTTVQFAGAKPTATQIIHS